MSHQARKLAGTFTKGRIAERLLDHPDCCSGAYLNSNRSVQKMPSNLGGPGTVFNETVMLDDRRRRGAAFYFCREYGGNPLQWPYKLVCQRS